MNTSRRHREDTIHELARAGICLADARALLRLEATLQRCAEAQCNGDWPFDNGERDTVPCSRCEAGVHLSAVRCGGLCPDCRAQDRVRKLLEGSAFEPVFAGDPRGAVLRIVPRGTPQEQVRNGTVRGIAVVQ